MLNKSSDRLAACLFWSQRVISHRNLSIIFHYCDTNHGKIIFLKNAIRERDICCCFDFLLHFTPFVGWGEKRKRGKRGPAWEPDPAPYHHPRLTTWPPLQCLLLWLGWLQVRVPDRLGPNHLCSQLQAGQRITLSWPL